MRGASSMHPNGVRQDRRGPVRTRYPTHVPPLRPGGESGRVLWGDRILFNPVGVSIAQSSPPQGTAPRRKARGRTLGMRAASRMHPDGVRQDRRGPIRARHHTHGPHFNPRTNRAVIRRIPHFVQPRWGCRAESSPPQGTAPRPTGPWSRTLGFGVPPRCGEDTHTQVLDGGHVVVKRCQRRFWMAATLW